jgi:prophage antirepressor-like protein
MATFKKLTTLDALNPLNIARSHQAGVIERERAKSRLKRQKQKKQRELEAQAAAQQKLNLNVHEKECEVAKPTKKNGKAGIELSAEAHSALIRHIDELGNPRVMADMENMFPDIKGLGSAMSRLYTLRREPKHRWSHVLFNSWMRLLACWNIGKRPQDLVTEGIDLVINGEVVTVVGRTPAAAPSVARQPSVVDAAEESVHDEQGPESTDNKALMSYQVNADGLPVMTMDGVVIRVAGTPERPLFCAADICKAIGHSNPSAAVAQHVDPGDVRAPSRDVRASANDPNYLTERGLYSLLLGVRRLPKAEPFRLWVTGEVLPSIRKTGSYATEAAQNARSMATTDRGMLVDVFTEVMTRMIPVIQQSAVAPVQRQEFDENGFEVPSGELPKTNKRAGVNGLIEQYHRDHPDVTREECHSMLHCRFKSAYNISPPKDHPKKIAWYEENGHIDALYALAYAMFSKRKAD